MFGFNNTTTSFNDVNDDSINDDSINDDSSEGWLAEYLTGFAFQSACYLIFKHFVEPLVIYFVKLLKIAWKSLMDLFFPDTDTESASQSQWIFRIA